MKTKLKKFSRSSNTTIYDHLSEAVIHFDQAIRALNRVDDLDEAFRDNPPRIDVEDVEDYVEVLRDEILRMKKWKQTVKKEAKAVTPATRRLIDATLNYWQPFPESLKYRIANKAELEVIDAKTFEIVLVLKKVRKRVFVFATPCVYGRPDFELVDVPHDKLDDLPGIMKKIQAWKEQEDSEEREYANRRRGTKVRGFITRGRSK